MTFTHGLLDRILGCGTLLIESGGERGQLVINEIPHVETVQRQLSDLVESANDPHAGPPAPADGPEPA